MIDRDPYLFFLSHRWIQTVTLVLSVCIAFASFYASPNESPHRFFYERPKLAVCVLFALYAAFLFSALYFMHEGLGTALWDFGFNDQIIWNTAHGDFLTTSIRGGHSILGEHFFMMLALLSPVYVLTDQTAVLFAVQALAIASVIPLVYAIAKEVTGSKGLALAFAIAAFFYQPLRSGVLFSFHSETFADPFLLFGFYLALKHRNAAAISAFLLALICKENMAVEVIGIGLFLAYKRRKLGMGLVALAFSVMALNIFVIEPHFRFPNWDKWGYFEHLVHPSPANWAHYFRSIAKPQTVGFVFQVFGPFLFLPFLAGGWLFLLGPALALHFLSSYEGFRIITAHYTVGLNALVFIAAIYGTSKIQSNKLPAALIFASMLFMGAPHLFVLEGQAWDASWPENQRSAKILESLPPDYSTVAAETLTAHLSHRRFMFQYPDPPAGSPDSSRKQNADWLFEDFKRMQTSEIVILETYVKRGYHPVFENPVLRIYASPALPPQTVQEYQQKWTDIQSGEAVPYRKTLRSLYRKLFIGILVLGFLSFFIKRKREGVPA